MLRASLLQHGGELGGRHPHAGRRLEPALADHRLGFSLPSGTLQNVSAAMPLAPTSSLS